MSSASVSDSALVASCERRVLDGRVLGRGDLLALSQAPLDQLAAAANRVRERLCGASFDLCAIINAKSGRCSEDCAFCAQSARHCAAVDEYPLVSIEEAVRRARDDAEAGVARFSLVTSGARLTSGEVHRVAKIVAAIKRDVGMGVCASLGLLSQEEFELLAEAGLDRMHNNLETSRAFFPHVCTTHAYDEKLRAIEAARAVGLEVCSGGIIGLGETLADRIDLALEVRATGACSMPVNVLNPIAGTPLADARFIGDDEVVRSVALFRFANPRIDVRLAGGRTLLAAAGRRCLSAGANALISGSMLTTNGFTIASDLAMARGAGFEPARLSTAGGPLVTESPAAPSGKDDALALVRG